MTEADDRMYELMGGDAAFEKISRGDGPGDTEESTVGVNPDQHPDPSEKGQEESETINARWGQEDQKPNAAEPNVPRHYSNAMLDEFKRGREGFLKRHFDAYESSKQTNKNILGQNLSHASSGDFTSSTAMSDAVSKQQPEKAKSLVEKTKNLLDSHG